MASAYIKRIIKIGGSLAIILPTEWAKGNVKAGQEMLLVGNGELRMFPVYPEEGRLPNNEETEGAEGN